MKQLLTEFFTILIMTLYFFNVKLISGIYNIKQAGSKLSRIEVIGEYEKRPDDRAKLLSGNRKVREIE
ncbi:hypothetical protein RCO48_18605 [Peribacillus frigoritolerans]|nr:hypothetical protein [Peribacillus frigoritolerans]